MAFSSGDFAGGNVIKAHVNERSFIPVAVVVVGRVGGGPEDSGLSKQ